MVRQGSYVLVTGAAGFLGMNIVRHLAETGRRALATTRRQGGPDALAKDYLAGLKGEVEWVVVDLRDWERVAALADDYPIGGVIHNAFVTPATLNYELENTREILTSNLDGTINTLELARRAGVQRYVFVSSSGVYRGAPDEEKAHDEDSPYPYLKMGAFYHITKIASEKVTERYAKIFGMKTASMRVPGIYGPMERPTPSRRRMGPSYRLLKLVLTDGKRKLRVKGLRNSTSWTYVMDTARCIVAGLDAPGPLSPVYNINCGYSFPLEEVLRAMKGCPGVDFQWEEVEREEDADFVVAPGGRRGPASIERARRELGWEPAYSVKQGVEEYCRWWIDTSRRGLWTPPDPGPKDSERPPP